MTEHLIICLNDNTMIDKYSLLIARRCTNSI